MVGNIVQGLMGGVIVGLAASLMLIFNGRVAGVSGIFNGILKFLKGDIAWRVYFVLGLLGGGYLISLVAPEAEEVSMPVRSLSVIAIGGILVGFGTVMSSGCTSGHGVCGLSRFSRRSFFAVLAFMLSGFVTATIFHLVTNASGGLQ